LKITRIEIADWRHFRNVEFDVPPDASVVCLVGGNGAGKSQILELVAAASQRAGLSRGASVARGDPFAESATFAVRFQLDIGVLPELEAALGTDPGLAGAERWDRTITIRSNAGQELRTAGGLSNPEASNFAMQVCQYLVNSRAVHYLHLDADRAYPNIAVSVHELGPAFERDWDGTRKDSASLISRNLYEEWFRYLLSIENSSNNQHV
jgi:hypothetical protein